MKTSSKASQVIVLVLTVWAAIGFAVYAISSAASHEFTMMMGSLIAFVASVIGVFCMPMKSTANISTGAFVIAGVMAFITGYSYEATILTTMGVVVLFSAYKHYISVTDFWGENISVQVPVVKAEVMGTPVNDPVIEPTTKVAS